MTDENSKADLLPTRDKRSAAPPGQGTTSTSARHLLLLFSAYFLIAFLFHAWDLNIFNTLIGGGDGYTAGLPSKVFAPRLSPWNPYVQLGQYSFANTQFQPFYPPALIIMANWENTLGYNIFILSHYALGGLFFYAFVRYTGIGKYASFVAGLSFMLSGFLSAHKGHQAMMSTAIWLPLMLLFMDRYARTSRIRELAWAAVAVAMSILAGFPQVTLYSMVILVAYSFYRLSDFRGPKWTWVVRTLYALGAVVGTSLLLSSFQLFAVAEALPHMTRETLTYAAFSENYLPIYQILALVMPNLYGGFFQVRTYAPEFNVVEVYSYMGLLPLALAYAAFHYYRRRNGDARFWVIVCLSAFLLLLGPTTPLHRLLFHVPVYNLFRAPARHLFELDFAIAVLFAMGLDIAIRNGVSQSARLGKSLARASNALALLFATVYAVSQVFLWAADSLNRMPVKALDDLNISPVMSLATARELMSVNLNPTFPTILLPTVFFVLSFVVLRMAATGRLNRLLIVSLPALIVADLFLAYSTLYSKPDTSALGRPEARPETAFLAQQQFDPDMYRIFTLDQGLSNTYPLLNMTYGWSAVNDYTPMWLKRYVAMTDFGLNGAMPPQNLSRPNVLAAASARYIIAQSQTYIDSLKSAQSSLGATTPLLSSPEMVTDRALRTAGGGYVLQSPDGTGVSLLQVEIPLQESTKYQIAFTSRAPSGAAKPLIVDLYGGAPYDRPAQDAVLAQIAPTPIQQMKVIDSGSNVPKRAYVRIYTQSPTPIEVSGVRISTVRAAVGSTDADQAVYRQVYAGADGIQIFYNTRALPRFRFAQRLRPCQSSIEARQILDSDVSFNVATDALVEGLSEPMSVSSGEVLSHEIGNNRMTFQLKTGERSLFIVGDSWFPGWRAKVDGKESQILVVDGFLRGVMLSGAGNHELEMSYHPWSVPAGALGTMLGMVIVAAAVYRGDRVFLKEEGAGAD